MFFELILHIALNKSQQQQKQESRESSINSGSMKWKRPCYYQKMLLYRFYFSFIYLLDFSDINNKYWAKLEFKFFKISIIIKENFSVYLQGVS